MQCPDCQRSLKSEATKCACGWSKAATRPENLPPVRPRCSRCTNDAQLKKRVGDRWENVCIDCDKAERTAEAAETCKAKGIHSAADARAWLGKNKLLVKHAPMREPGEDDE